MKQKPVEKSLKLRVDALCIDKKGMIVMGSPDCMMCFNAILKDFGHPCLIYENGIYLKHATLKEADRIMMNTPQRGSKKPSDNVEIG